MARSLAALRCGPHHPPSCARCSRSSAFCMAVCAIASSGWWCRIFTPHGLRLHDKDSSSEGSSREYKYKSNVYEETSWSVYSKCEYDYWHDSSSSSSNSSSSNSSSSNSSSSSRNSNSSQEVRLLDIASISDFHFSALK